MTEVLITVVLGGCIVAFIVEVIDFIEEVKRGGE